MLFKYHFWASEKAQRVGVLAANTGDSSSVSILTKWKESTDSYKLFSDLHNSRPTYITYTHKNKDEKIKFTSVLFKFS